MSRKFAVADDEEEQFKLVSKNLVDHTRINKDYNYNNITIFKHKMDDVVDLSSLEPLVTETTDQFGSYAKKTYYNIATLPKNVDIRQLKKVTNQVSMEFTKLLPDYKYYVASQKVEIYNSDRSNLNYISCRLTINHEKKIIYNNLILA